MEYGVPTNISLRDVKGFGDAQMLIIELRK
jgi:hypothetical protein